MWSLNYVCSRTVCVLRKMLHVNGVLKINLISIPQNRTLTVTRPSFIAQDSLTQAALNSNPLNLSALNWSIQFMYL